MVFLTVCDSFNTKVSAFVAGKSARSNFEYCSLITMFRFAPADHELHTSFDLGLYHAGILNIGSPADLDEFLERVRRDNESTQVLIQVTGHENDSRYVHFSTQKSIGDMLNINGTNLRTLCGGRAGA